jgi:hypothetical protein
MELCDIIINDVNLINFTSTAEDCGSVLNSVFHVFAVAFSNLLSRLICFFLVFLTMAFSLIL